MAKLIMTIAKGRPGSSISLDKKLEEFGRSGQKVLFIDDQIVIDEQNEGLTKRINQRINEGYKGKRAIRRDAVKYVVFMFSMSKELAIDRKTKLERYWESCLNWTASKFGTKNIVKATIHTDGTVPYLYVVLVPLTHDGRLSAKEVVGNKQILQIGRAHV